MFRQAAWMCLTLALLNACSAAGGGSVQAYGEIKGGVETSHTR